MNRILRSIIIILVLGVFLINTCCYGVEISPFKLYDKIAVYSFLQDRDFREIAEELNTVYTIAEYLLGNPEKRLKPLPPKYFESVMTSELGRSPSGIDLSGVEIKGEKVLIPYAQSDKKCIIQFTSDKRQPFNGAGNKKNFNIGPYEIKYTIDSFQNSENSKRLSAAHDSFISDLITHINSLNLTIDQAEKLFVESWNPVWGVLIEQDRPRHFRSYFVYPNTLLRYIITEKGKITVREIEIPKLKYKYSNIDLNSYKTDTLTVQSIKLDLKNKNVLFKAEVNRIDGISIETVAVLRPGQESICVSVATGCMNTPGCKFCGTGEKTINGEIPNISLTRDEIKGQVDLAIQFVRDNIDPLFGTGDIQLSVMGMGEAALYPEAVLGAVYDLEKEKIITKTRISSVGNIKMLERMKKMAEGIFSLDENIRPPMLQLSLQSSDDKKRRELVRNPQFLSDFDDIIKFAIDYNKTFEILDRLDIRVTLMEGINDTQEDARLMAERINSICRREKYEGAFHIKVTNLNVVTDVFQPPDENKRDIYIKAIQDMRFSNIFAFRTGGSLSDVSHVRTVTCGTLIGEPSGFSVSENSRAEKCLVAGGVLPPSMDFVVTTKCSEECVVCFGVNMPEHIESGFEEKKKMINRLYENGVKRLIFTGGEPLLAHRLQELLKHAYDKGMTVVLYTNGRFMNEERAQKIMPYVHMISLPLNGYDESSNVQGAKPRGRFTDTLRVLRMMKEKYKDKEIQVLTIMTKTNQSYLRKIGRLLMKETKGMPAFHWKLSLYERRGRTVMLYPNSSQDPFFLSYDDFQSVVEPLTQEFRELNTRYSPRARDKAYLFMLANGMILTTENNNYLELGTIFSDSTLNNPENRKIFSEITSKIIARAIPIKQKGTGSFYVGGEAISGNNQSGPVGSRYPLEFYKSEFAKNHAQRVKRIALLLGRRWGLPKKLADEVSFACVIHDLGTPEKTENISPEAEKRVRAKFKEVGILLPEKKSRNVNEYCFFSDMFAERGNEFSDEDKDFVLDIYEPCAAISAAKNNGISISRAVETAVLFHHHIRELSGYLDGRTDWSLDEKREVMLIASLLVAADIIEKGMNLFKRIFLNKDSRLETLDETREYLKNRSEIPEDELKKILDAFDEVKGTEKFKEISADAQKMSDKELHDLKKTGREQILSDMLHFPAEDEKSQIMPGNKLNKEEAIKSVDYSRKFTEKDKKHMRDIIDYAGSIMAEDESFKTLPVVARIVDKNGNVIVTTSRKKLDEPTEHGVKAVHAEVQALKEAAAKGFNDWSKAVMYINIDSCYACSRALAEFYGVGRVVYGVEDPTLSEHARNRDGYKDNGVELVRCDDGAIRNEIKTQFGELMKKTVKNSPWARILHAKEKEISVFFRDRYTEVFGKDIQVILFDADLWNEYANDKKAENALFGHLEWLRQDLNPLKKYVVLIFGDDKNICLAARRKILEMNMVLDGEKHERMFKSKEVLIYRSGMIPEKVTEKPCIDMHMHSTASDGQWMPEKILNEARKLGLKVIAITDHENMEIYTPEFLRKASGQGVEVIPGVEITSLYQGNDLDGRPLFKGNFYCADIVGLFPRLSDEKEKDYFDRLNELHKKLRFSANVFKKWVLMSWTKLKEYNPEFSMSYRELILAGIRDERARGRSFDADTFVEIQRMREEDIETAMKNPGNEAEFWNKLPSSLSEFAMPLEYLFDLCIKKGYKLKLGKDKSKAILTMEKQLADKIEEAGVRSDSEGKKKLIRDCIYMLNGYFLDHPYEYFGKPGKQEDGGVWWLDNTETVIKFINSNKGYSIFAHPSGQKEAMGAESFEKMISKLKSCGLAGIEAFSRGQEPIDSIYFNGLAIKNRLLTTNGSDFHTVLSDRNMAVGTNNGSNQVHKAMIDSLVEKRIISEKTGKAISLLPVKQRNLNVKGKSVKNSEQLKGVELKNKSSGGGLDKIILHAVDEAKKEFKTKKPDKNNQKNELIVNDIFAAIIMCARSAGREGKTVTMAFDFSWIPGFIEDRSVRDMVNSIVSSPLLLKGALESMGIDNINVVIRKWSGREKQYESIESWAREITDNLVVPGDFSDVMVLGSMEALDYFKGKWKDEKIVLDKRAFLAGIDSSQFDMNLLTVGCYWDLRFFGMLRAAIKAFKGSDISELEYVDRSRSNFQEKLLIFLPRAVKKDIEVIIDKNKAQRKALLSV
ncbi:MAG: radical SAM protein [Candidatus Omnitrophota bacterium]